MFAIVIVITGLAVLTMVEESVCDRGVDWESKLVTVFQANARFRAKWCSDVVLDEATLKSAFACQWITVMDQHKLKQAYDTCLTVVFGSLRSKDYAFIRKQACSRKEANRFFVKCLIDEHWKLQPDLMQQLTRRGSRKETLMRLLPVLMERIQCQNDAIGVNPFQDSDENSVEDTKVDVNSISLSLLLHTALNERDTAAPKS